MTALAVLGLGSTVGLALLIRFDLPQLRGLAAVIPLGAFVPVFAPLICREIVSPEPITALVVIT